MIPIIPADIPLLNMFGDRTRTSILRSSGRQNLAFWIEKNTTDPFNPSRPWSFDKHEYQKGILGSSKPHTVIRKAAQAGVSELAVRTALGLCSLYSGTNFIYVLPSLMFARKFSVSRIDPVIQNSEVLSSVVSKDVDSSEIKRIGDSFLFVGGAQKQSQAISIPAKGLFRDEHDFCDPQVLTTFESRLGHNAPGEEIIFDFSTPTVPGYGISKLYERGDKSCYFCLHEKCGQWVEVDPATSIVLPGFDQPLNMLHKSDLSNPLVKPNEAWVKCPHCGGEITLANLADPESRAWVPEFPDRDIASFYVSPLDVPTINPPSKVVKRIESYETTSDWINFALGTPFASAENKIVEEAFEKALRGQVVYPRDGAANYTVMGMDIGKMSHLLVGREVEGKLHVIWAERIRQTDDNELCSRYLQIQRQYGAVKGVIDAAPDLTVPKMAIARSLVGQVWGSYFVQGRGPSSLGFFSLDEIDQVVKIYRTRIMDEVVRLFNKGDIILPREHPDLPILRKHLLAMNRIRKDDVEGNEKAVWISDGDDHYFLALVYLVAAKMMTETLSNVIPLNLLKGNGIVNKVKMKVAS